MRIYHPAFGSDIGVSGVQVSEDPDTQVNQVIGMMLDYSDADAGTPELLSDAENGEAMTPGDPLTGNLFDVKRRIRFVHDEQTAAPFTSFLKGPIVETLIRPIDMRAMRAPQGDCDDFAMTMRARMLALGIPAGFATVAVDPDDPERYSHVYVVADCSSGKCGPRYDGRVPLDASHGSYAGWEAPNPFGKRRDWGIGYESPNWPAIAGVALFLAALAAIARSQMRRKR